MKNEEKEDIVFFGIWLALDAYRFFHYLDIRVNGHVKHRQMASEPEAPLAALELIFKPKHTYVY